MHLTKPLALFAMTLCVAACDSGAVQLTPSPPMPIPPPPAPPPVIDSTREIVVGERVEGVLGDGRMIHPGEHHFYVTAPKDGTLEVVLEWDAFYLGTLLLLKLEEQTYRSSAPAWSPVVGRMRVEAGRRYLIVVAMAGADWIPQDPFVLTSRLEP